MAKKCQIVNNRVVMSDGSPIPRDTPGRLLKDKIDHILGTSANAAGTASGYYTAIELEEPRVEDDVGVFYGAREQLEAEEDAKIAAYLKQIETLREGKRQRSERVAATAAEKDRKKKQGETKEQAKRREQKEAPEAEKTKRTPPVEPPTPTVVSVPATKRMVYSPHNDKTRVEDTGVIPVKTIPFQEGVEVPKPRAQPSYAEKAPLREDITRRRVQNNLVRMDRGQ